MNIKLECIKCNKKTVNNYFSPMFLEFYKEPVILCWRCHDKLAKEIDDILNEKEKK